MGAAVKIWPLLVFTMVVSSCATTSVYVEPAGPHASPDSVLFVMDLSDTRDDEIGVHLIIVDELRRAGYDVRRVNLETFRHESPRQAIYLTYGFNAVNAGFGWAFQSFEVVWQDLASGRVSGEAYIVGGSGEGYRGATRRLIREMLREFQANR